MDLFIFFNILLGFFPSFFRCCSLQYCDRVKNVCSFCVQAGPRLSFHKNACNILKGLLLKRGLKDFMTVFAKFHWNGFNKPNLIVIFFFLLLLFYVHKASVRSELMIKFSKVFPTQLTVWRILFFIPTTSGIYCSKDSRFDPGGGGLGTWCKGLVTLFLKSLGVRTWSSSVWI